MAGLAVKEKGSQSLAVASEINDMFGTSTPQIPVDAPLPQIKILRESPMFEMPDGEVAKELSGHIIYYTNANQYYSKAFGEGDNVVPDCFSSNGIAPDGGDNRQAGPCKSCPLNQFGSGKDGIGKACANTIRLYVLLDGDIMGSVIKASPASLGKKDSLMRWLTNAPNVANKAGVGAAYQPIKVRFKLHKKDFSSGFSASVLDLETIKVLDPKKADEMTEIKKLAAITCQFKENYLGRIAHDMAHEKGDDVTPSDGLPSDSPEVPA